MMNNQAIEHERLWEVKTGDEPIYSTPVFAVYSNGKRVVIYQSWDWYIYVGEVETGETNSRATVFDYEPRKKAVVFGGLAGFVYCLDGQANTMWRTYLAANMRGSTTIQDINLDGEYGILVPDMMGTLTILNKHGKEIGQINMKGGIEGTPLVGDLDGDGKVEVFLTSLDGYVSMFRFL